MSVMSRYGRGLLSFALIVLAFAEGRASAQGALTNGDTHTGTIATPGQIDVWTFSAGQGDFITLAIGEIVANPDPGFVPFMQLKNHDTGTIITTVTGTLAAQIAVNAPLTANYDVLVRDSNINRPGTALGSYTLTLVKSPGSLVVHAGDQGGAMTNGANHPGSVYTGDLDAWTFTAAKDDYITLAVGEVLESEIDPLFVPWIRLIGPTGALITSAQGNLAAQVAATAPLSGTYTVLISDSAINREPSHPGDYILTMVKTNAALTVPNGDEGGPMTNGANHGGLVTVGDLDGWTFTAAKDDYIALSIGEVLQSEIDPGFVPWIRLLGPNGDLITSAQGTLAAQIATTAPLSGLYTVVVSDSAINREPSHTDNYILTLVKTNAALTVPNDDQGGPMTNGANHAGAIYVGDLDAWTFTAAQGDYIALSVGEILQSEIDPQFVPWIRLIGPTGDLVASAVGNLAAQIAANAPLSGLYTVIVSDSAINREPSHVSTYVVRLAKTATALTVPNGDEGGPMISGANYGGVISVGDLDAYTFTAAQGDYIAIKIGEVVLSEIDPLFVPWIRLIGPTGALVSSDIGNLTATIAANAPLSGTYTLLVTDSAINREPSHEGSYVLTMFTAPGTFVVPNGDTGGTLLNNVPRSGAMYSGDLDEWKFLAASGHSLNVTISEVISGTDPGFIPWIRLIGPTGTLVAQAVGTLTATINVIAPATGTYTVIVADSDINREGSAIGNYTLTAIGVDPNVCDSGAVAGITTIRAVDVNSLRDRINFVRGHVGLPVFTFTDADLAGAPVRAIHFLELRSALLDAYTAAGQSAPTFTDSLLTPQVTFIKAIHLNQLCAAVAVLE
jgi:trimeric autotransporter adhesin